jgi:hypothetical protein
MTDQGPVTRFIARAGATVAGLVVGAVIGGAGLGQLVYTLKKPDGSFGYEFDGFGEVLFFGFLGAIAGAITANVVVGRTRRGVRGGVVLPAAIWFLVGVLPGFSLGTYMYEHVGPGKTLYPPDAPPKCRSPYVTTENCGNTMPYQTDPDDKQRPAWVLGGVLAMSGSAAFLALSMKRRSLRRRADENTASNGPSDTLDPDGDRSGGLGASP